MAQRDERTSYARDFVAAAKAALAIRTVVRPEDDDDIDAPDGDGSLDPYAGAYSWGET